MTERYEHRLYTDKSGAVVIDAQITGEDKEKIIISFRIMPGHTLTMQTARAKEYAEYLNIQERAMQKAAQEVTLVTAVARRMTGQPGPDDKP